MGFETGRVLRGDVFERFKDIPDSSIDAVVTSPPYWGLRDYEDDEQIGLESDFRDYVSTIADVCDEVARVLKPSGSMHINLGDTYNTNSIVRSSASAAKMQKGDEEYEEYHTVEGRERAGRTRRKTDPQIPHKSKLFVPHRVAIELTSRGWIVRNDIPWVKPSTATDSATDRYRNKHEYFFFATRSKDYYFDLPNDTSGDVIEQSTSSFDGDHYATYPPSLVEPMVVAACPPGGVVLDPFAGSGSTLIAAARNDREWVGIELRDDYATMAENRAKEIEKQPTVMDYL